MKRQMIIRISKLLLSIITTIVFISNYSFNLISSFLYASLFLIIVQFIYGFFAYKLERINITNTCITCLYALFLLIVSILTFKSHIGIILINVISIILVLSLLKSFIIPLRSKHNYYFSLLVFLGILTYVLVKYGNNIFISYMFIPIFLSYLLQYVIFREKKINVSKVTIYTIWIIIILISSLIFKHNLILNYEIDINLCLLIVMELIILIREKIHISSVRFSKIELMVLSYLLVIFILKLNSILIVPLIPLIILSLSFSLEEKWEIIHIKKYFKVKDENIKKVSAIIPNYNYGHYIEKRIDSILKQNYPLYELIILDDKSTDNSDTIIKRKLEEVKVKYPTIKFKYIPNTVNSGSVFKQWTKAFKESSGDYVWICEADDLCSKYFLNTVMRGFNDKDVVLSYAESKAIDENGIVIKSDMRNWNDIANRGRWNSSYIIDGKIENSKYLSINNSINNASGVVFKKDKKIPYNKYLEESQKFKLAGDWLFYTNVLMHGKIAYFADSLNYHRIHSKSVTNTTKEKQVYKEIVRVQESVAKNVKISEETQKYRDKYNKGLRKNYNL